MSAAAAAAASSHGSGGGAGIRIALLEGPSGIGKSALIQEALLTNRHCWVASGKFNENLTANPFSAM
jgi:predicted ATPase